jgi:thioesterase domain-containing protein
VIGGYSGGGVLAYEIAQQLQAAGEEVELLILIDTYHPTIRARPFSWKKRLQRIIFQPTDVIGQIWERWMQILTIRRLFKQYVAPHRQVPLEKREPLISDFFLQVKQQYAPQPYAGPTLLIHSRDHFPAYRHVPPHLGWEQDIAQLHIEDISGNHFDIVKEPYAQALVQAICATQQRIREGQWPPIS